MDDRDEIIRHMQAEIESLRKGVQIGAARLDCFTDRPQHADRCGSRSSLPPQPKRCARRIGHDGLHVSGSGDLLWSDAGDAFTTEGGDH